MCGRLDSLIVSVSWLISLIGRTPLRKLVVSESESGSVWRSPSRWVKIAYAGLGV